MNGTGVKLDKADCNAIKRLIAFARQAQTRIKTLEAELTELRAERDAWRRSLAEEEIIEIDEGGNVHGPERLLAALAGK